MGVVVALGHRAELAIPEELTDQIIVIDGEYNPSHGSFRAGLTTALATLKKRFDSKYAGLVVVPLREGGITFIPEVPNAQGRDSKYRHGEGRNLVANGARRKHNDRAYGVNS
jgi:hypothetical protein